MIEEDYLREIAFAEPKPRLVDETPTLLGRDIQLVGNRRQIVETKPDVIAESLMFVSPHRINDISFYRKPVFDFYGGTTDATIVPPNKLQRIVYEFRVRGATSKNTVARVAMSSDINVGQGLTSAMSVSDVSAADSWAIFAAIAAVKRYQMGQYDNINYSIRYITNDSDSYIPFKQAIQRMQQYDLTMNMLTLELIHR